VTSLITAANAVKRDASHALPAQVLGKPAGGSPLSTASRISPRSADSNIACTAHFSGGASEGLTAARGSGSLLWPPP
jgi:hypothetical protein